MASRHITQFPPVLPPPATVWVAWERRDDGPRIVAVAADELTARRAAMELITSGPQVTEVPLDGSAVSGHLLDALIADGSITAGPTPRTDPLIPTLRGPVSDALPTTPRHIISTDPADLGLTAGEER